MTIMTIITMQRVTTMITSMSTSMTILMIQVSLQSVSYVVEMWMLTRYDISVVL